jgi:hypothetical protein
MAHWRPTDADREKIQTIAAIGLPQAKIGLVSQVAPITHALRG